MPVPIESQESRAYVLTGIAGIPIRNIWLLMLYASDLFRHLEQRRIRVEDCPDEIPDLVGEILADVVERRLKRSLNFGYHSRDAVLSRVRGKISALETASRQLLSQGKVACHFEELTLDTTRNRLVRAALEKMVQIASRGDLSRRCLGLARVMANSGVSGEKPARHQISAEGSHRIGKEDRFMVSAARLVFELAIPTETRGAVSLSSPDRDIVWLRKLYEKGVAGFYAVVLPAEGWVVHAGKSIDWKIDAETPGIKAILPGMRTDIVLESRFPRTRTVIDTKFTSLITKGWHREEVIKSGYIYQVYSYLRSQESSGDDSANTANGMLLYPSVGTTIDEMAVIQGHAIRFATIDLNSAMREIRSNLLKLIEFKRPVQLSNAAQGGAA
ncbi:MAG TPA: 5-methylcytosine-specific restriction endonuclease system specificity protein McrC [Fibrobacteria bacterium]|nr:5-methylcytosine-specific restriction endonuclease system specificity protein McrC [Fibrobacteria bacterium]